MAISKDSIRIQLTLNSNKPKEKVILNYLSLSFNQTQEVKRILYEYVMNQNELQVVRDTRSDEKLLTITKNEVKKAKETESKYNENDKKLLTSTEDSKKLITSNKSDVKVEDFTLNVSEFKDDVVEVNNNNDNIIEQNEIDELSKFL